MMRATMMVLAVTLTGCGGNALSDAHEARAKEALKPFQRELLTTVMQELPGGAANAVNACNAKAPAIAAKQSQGQVKMGRTSHRLRNPDNGPEDWMKPLLASYVGSTRGSMGPEMVVLDDERFGYVEPIYVNDMCLTCHGDVHGSVGDALAAHYPDDEATGFADGDFRGIFWVTMPIEP